jgi:23S rRNA pseudouridine1911/1915/1917 synthase
MPDDEALRFYERSRLTPEAEAKLILPRHALHASEIRFMHPVSEEMMTFKSPLPKDLQGFLDEMKVVEGPVAQKTVVAPLTETRSVDPSPASF